VTQASPVKDLLIPESIAFRFRARLRTRWSDEDKNGVLNNAAYMTLLEEARHAYFDQLDLLEEGRFPFLLAQTTIQFLKPGRGSTEVIVELATTHLGGSSFHQVCRVIELEGSEIWCEAENVLVCWDDVLRTSRPLTPEFRRTIEGFERPAKRSTA